MNEVISFINNFKNLNTSIIEDCFSYGNCYWFAKILIDRFGGTLYYDEINNHFFTKIKNTFYDIKGAYIPGSVGIYSWSEYILIEPLNASRIYKNCILKEY